MKQNKISSFTLAEILLVLAILGITATLTIPNLTKNIDEEKNIAALKTIIGQIDAATVDIMREYNSFDAAITCTDLNYGACFGQKLANKLNVTQNCTTKIKPCVSNDTLFSVDPSNYANDNYIITKDLADSCDYAFLLKNGASVCVRQPTYYDKTMLNIDVDVDGPKRGQNKRGVDSFEITVSEDGIEYLNEDGRGQTVANNLYTVQAKKSGKFVFEYDLTDWIMTVGNMDYLRCNAQNLTWTTRTCQ